MYLKVEKGSSLYEQLYGILKGDVKHETRLAASDCGQFCLLIMLIMLIVHFVKARR